MKIKQFFKSITLLVASVAVLPAMAVDMTGAGSTFFYPICAKWAETYKASTGHGLNYQSIGSGGGIKQIKAKTVDFGATDKPLGVEELEASGLTQFPIVMGGLVAIVNLDGVAPGQMKMTGQLLADIYLGKVTKWNAAEIAALNPGMKLPADDITPVYRADGSGTTFLWTNYLSKVSAEFKGKIGSDTAVKWPVGVGGKGNEGVAANVQRLKGSIGYVEYAYAKRNKIAHTQLKNKEGQWLQPDDETFKAAAASADWLGTPGYGVILTEQPGKTSWPITGAVFVLMHKNQADGAKGKEVLKFFDWALKSGDKMATELEYVPMPDAVGKAMDTAWKGQFKDAGGKAIW